MKKIITSVAMLLTIGAANAGVIQIGSQASLTASGTIAQNTNWDAYGTGFSFPGSPFVVGQLTFVQSGQNLIGGTGTGFALSRNLITDNYVSGTTALIAGAYDLLGFNAGNFFAAGNATFNVVTDLGSYTFTESISSATNGGALTFVGFEATGGEHFVSINWTGSQATGLTDIQIGDAGTVPEPASVALVGVALLGIGAARKRSQKQ